MIHVDMVLDSKRLVKDEHITELNRVELIFKLYLHGTNIEEDKLIYNGMHVNCDLDSNEFNRQVIINVLNADQDKYKISSIVFEK